MEFHVVRQDYPDDDIGHINVPEEHQSRSRAYRRHLRDKKNNRRVNSMQYRGYYYCNDYLSSYQGGIPRRLEHSGYYIKYCKTSKRKQCLKKAARKKARNCPYLPPKGNYYRRVFDYWWELD